MNVAALIRRLVLVKEGELAALIWSGTYFFCLLFSYYLLRPYRDEMGIRGDLDKLPWLWTGTAIATLAAAPLFALLVSRMPRRRFVPITYRFFATNLVVFYGLFLAFPAKGHIGIGYAFYIWLSVFNLFIVSVFWGFMADVFNPEQAKRLFGAIGVGGTLGAICGSAVPASLVKGFAVGGWTFKIDPVHLLLLSIVFLELAAQCVRRLVLIFGLDERVRHVAAKPNQDASSQAAAQSAPVKPAPSAQREPGRGVFTGFILIAKSPYLLTMCGYMLLFTVTSTFLAFEQARIIKATLADPSSRVSYLATIDLLVNILALTTQLFFTGRILSRLGVTAGLLLLPLVTNGGFLWLAALPTTLALMIVQVGRRGLHYAVDRPTREVLYTVLGPEEKYKSKSFIDTFVYRGGDLLGAWTDHLLNKAGIAVATTAIVVSLVWASAGFALGALNRRIARRAAQPKMPTN